jgi:uncharacterized protein
MWTRLRVGAVGAAMVAIALCGVAAAGQLEDGMAAQERGDPATAMRLLRPLAERGDTRAQLTVGFLYMSGQGVPPDNPEAFKWFRLAANQGEPMAQFNLGSMYRLGWGVPQDYVSAHAWYSLAAAQGVEQAVENRDKLAKLMTPDQITEAQRLASEWVPKSAPQ